MADPTQRITLNVAGRYYVDNSCCDCDLCRQVATHSMKRDDETGNSYVFRQPETPEEVAAVEEAAQCCPTTAIGSNA